MQLEVSYIRMETSEDELMNSFVQTTNLSDFKPAKWTLTQEQPNRIRPLIPTDDELETLCRYGKEFSEASNAGGFCKKTFLKSVDTFLKSQKAKIFMLEINGKVAGTVGVYAYRCFYNDVLRVQEIFWWVDPEYRNTRDSIKLFNKVEEWAQEIGADEVMVSSTILNADKIEKFYTKKGFRKMDINYIRSLNHA